MNNNECESNDDAIPNIFYNEFTCQINADILPSNWNSECYLNTLAKGSATRLSLVVEPTKLIEIFNEMIRDREHYLNKLTSEASNFEWVIESEEWVAYVKLLNKIIKFISIDL
ncbi:hypothetical protein IPZ60_03260 [Psychrobacter sp. NG25]|uniref:hypothetical protein n=1 Tax=Psychrobacter sp. NG25 TaxID=2782005 RepID=UPI0018847F25|nr:hypothetical protein [Psychrobacter sp. NG25]MBF0657756.1 hypothetical protein [Psychrobacter sp. NG25]